jgi:TolB-like protein/Tfp pilus assembly protein PilF/predicted Ser/Thr protein kinase
MIGKTISHYRIIEKIGEGGMGVVYKALDTKLDRHAAIKILPPHLGADRETIARFIQEAKTASALDHSNIGTIYEIDDTVEGEIFIAMAYYEGETLRDRIDRGRMGNDEILVIAREIAAGLGRAHESAIVHRDLKPSNILITNRGEVKIIDFGLAKLAGTTKLTRAGSLLGTAAYMSPEQATGEEIDHRADIFSLGVILYEMLSGERPFRGEHEAALLYEIVHEDPVPISSLDPGIDPGIDLILQKAMAKRPEERYGHIGELIEDLESVMEGGPAAVAGAAGGARRHGRSRRFVLAGWAAVVLAAMTVVVLYLMLWRGETIDSIAVLPLENLSQDEGEEYFVCGMTDELISRLARVGGLKVISRTSAMRYKDSTKPLPEIARELAVQAVLEGSVLRIGDRVRIAVELIHAGTDRSIWAESYERDIRDILNLQSEVAQDVARKIKTRLTAADEEQLSTVPPVTAEAHEDYLKGRYYLNTRTPEALRTGLQYFESSIEKDSGFAPAYAGMADAYILLAGYSVQDPETIYERAREAALRAIEIDERLSEAHASLAIVRWHYEWDFNEAEREFRRALSFNQNCTTAHHWYSLYLTFSGRFDEAIAQIRMARSVDPVSLIVNAAVGLVYYYAERYDEALEQSLLSLEMNDRFFPAYTVLGRVYTRKGMFGEAIHAFETVIELSGRRSSALSLLAHPFSASGREVEAEALYEELLTRSKTEYVSPFDMAILTMALGRHEETIDWLERSYDERAFDIMSMQAEPLFEGLRADPRFAELTKKIGLFSGASSVSSESPTSKTSR